jgi:putative restriction endonuclease
MINDNPINKPITRQHVDQAAKIWQKQPGIRGFRDSRNYSVIIDGNPYPPKAIISIANELAGNGTLYPGDFPGAFDGKWHKKLTGINYDIVEKNDFLINSLLAEDEKTKDQLNQVMSASNLTDTEKLQLVMSRVGQGDFRKSVIERANGKCEVTGVDQIQMLVASHIKAWADCESSSERLDPDNGLLLTPNLDKLFDRGFISFSNEGEMLAKKEKWILDFLDHQSNLNLKTSLNKKQKLYLDQHRRKFNFS